MLQTFIYIFTHYFQHSNRYIGKYTSQLVGGLQPPSAKLDCTYIKIHTSRVTPSGILPASLDFMLLNVKFAFKKQNYILYVNASFVNVSYPFLFVALCKKCVLKRHYRHIGIKIGFFRTVRKTKDGYNSYVRTVTCLRSPQPAKWRGQAARHLFHGNLQPHCGAFMRESVAKRIAKGRLLQRKRSSLTTQNAVFRIAKDGILPST